MAQINFGKPLKFAVAISTFLIAPLGYANNSQEEQQRYQALAERYQQLAEYYQSKANELTETSAESSTQAVKVPLSIAVNDDSTLSPWSTNTDTNDNIVGLPEGLADSDAVKKAKDFNKVKEPWKGTTFGGGGSWITGNSAGSSFNANANITYKPTVPWTNTAYLSYQFTETEAKGTTANQFQTQAQTTYNFNKNNGVFASVNYLNNKFDAYDFTITEAVGYIRDLYRSKYFEVSAQAGPSLTQQRENTAGATIENALGAQMQANLKWNISDTSSFTQSAQTNYTQDGTQSQLRSILSVKIFEKLIWQLTLQLNNTSNAPVGKYRTNTTTTTSINYAF